MKKFIQHHFTLWKDFMHKSKKHGAGFTLVELLVVIAVLGILAAGLLTVIDPLEQIQRGRDATRIAQVNQLGNAMTAYFVAQQAYPPLNNTWITSLVDAGELKGESVNNSSTVDCTRKANDPAVGQNGFCYNTDSVAGNARAIVFVDLESKSQRKKAGCSLNGVKTTFFVWSSVYGKAGVVCTSSTDANDANNNSPTLDSHSFVQ